MKWRTKGSMHGSATPLVPQLETVEGSAVPVHPVALPGACVCPLQRPLRRQWRHVLAEEGAPICVLDSWLVARGQ